MSMSVEILRAHAFAAEKRNLGKEVRHTAFVRKSDTQLFNSRATVREASRACATVGLNEREGRRGGRRREHGRDEGAGCVWVFCPAAQPGSPYGRPQRTCVSGFFALGRPQSRPSASCQLSPTSLGSRTTWGSPSWYSST